MIKNVKIFYKPLVWARGGEYAAAPNVQLEEGELVFDKDYPRGTSTHDIWEEVKKHMVDYFFAVFFPAVVWRTLPPKEKTDSPTLALGMQSKHVRKRYADQPELYYWNPHLKRWHFDREAYRKRTLERGGPIEIGIGDELLDWNRLDELQEQMEGQTVRLPLFVYPDRYDQVIRAMFWLVVTFWEAYEIGGFKIPRAFGPLTSEEEPPYPLGPPAIR